MYVHTVSHGVLWSRLCHRPGEEDQRKLPQRRLDRLHLSRGAQGKVDSQSQTHKKPFIYLLKKKQLLLCIIYPTTCWFGLLKKVIKSFWGCLIWFFDSLESQQRTDGWWKIHNAKLKKKSHRKYQSTFLPFVLCNLCNEAREMCLQKIYRELLSCLWISLSMANWTELTRVDFSFHTNLSSCCQGDDLFYF